MFRIGDFSRLARVTIKTLHHYDEAGLLQPSHVDRQTGYRYYAAAQLETLQRILLLKDLGFALDEIRKLLAADSQSLSGTLERRRAELSQSIALDQSRLRRLEALQLSLSGGGTAEPPIVVLRDTPAIEVYSIRERVPHLGSTMQALFEAAEATVAAAHARSTNSPFTIFHDLEYREDDVDVEVCIPVKSGSATRLVRQKSRLLPDVSKGPRPLSTREIDTRVVPGSRSMGCITYRGSYQQTPSLYAALLQWMDHSGLRIDGPLREVYHRYGADQIGYRLPAHVLASSSAEYVTELQAPVAPEMS